MPSIRKVRKAFKRKNGLKEFSVLFKFKNRAIRFTPTMRKKSQTECNRIIQN